MNASNSYLSTNTKRILIKSGYWLLGLFLLVGAAAWLRYATYPPTSAPELTFNTLTGNKIALKELRGKPVLVSFWATDCPSCIAEIPHLADLYHRYHCTGLEIIAISRSYDPPNHVVEMVKAKQIPYSVVLDITAEYAEAFGKIRLIPNTFLIAPDGTVATHKIGEFDPNIMSAQIATFTKDKSCSG